MDLLFNQTMMETTRVEALTSTWPFKENPAQYAIPSGQMGYLVAAGGGSGANSGAGGGAGGLRTTYGTTSGGGASAETNLTLAAGTYTITVGAGGVSRGAGSSPPAYGGQGLSGSDSTITGVASVSTVGGGGGGFKFTIRSSANFSFRFRWWFRWWTRAFCCKWRNSRFRDC